MNLPERWGIGYQLSNNDIGIMWNDGSKLLLKPDFNRLFYFNEHDVLLYSDAYSSISKGNSPGKSNEKFNQIKNSKSSKPSLQTIIEWRCVEEVWGCTNHSLQAGDIQITAYRTRRFWETSEFKKKLSFIEYWKDNLQFVSVRKVWNDYQSSNSPERTVFIK